MKLKNLIVTVAVLAALSAVVFLIRRPGPPASADPRLKQPLIEQAAIEKAAKLRLTDQGKTVELVRQPDGTWRVPSYHDLPADFQKLSGFVNSLTEAKLERLVTSNADRLARLEFKDTKIELLDSADKVLAAVTLGSNGSTGGRYVRFADEPKAYLASLNAWLDTEPKNWAAAELLALKTDDVAKVEIPFAEGRPVTLSRAKKDEAWTSAQTPASQRVNAAKVTSLISTIGNLRFSDTSSLDDPNVAAAKAHQRAVKLTTFDHKTITIALGRKPEEKKLKPPTAGADGGPAALGSLSDLAKKDEKKDDAQKAGEPKSDAAKPLTPEFETIPPGPVFATVTHSDAAAPVNALMQKRAFQVSDFTFTSLPQKPEELFEPAPTAPTPGATSAPAPAAPEAPPADASTK